MSKTYETILCYGWEEHRNGDTYHAFELAHTPDDIADMEERLRDALELEPDDETYHWNYMHIRVPEKLVAEIKADAVKEYLENASERVPRA